MPPGLEVIMRFGNDSMSLSINVHECVAARGKVRTPKQAGIKLSASSAHVHWQLTHNMMHQCVQFDSSIIDDLTRLEWSQSIGWQAAVH